MQLEPTANSSESGDFIAKYILTNGDEIDSNRFQINFLTTAGQNLIDSNPPLPCLDCSATALVSRNLDTRAYSYLFDGPVPSETSIGFHEDS